jgi:hypothetical protein
MPRLFILVFLLCALLGHTAKAEVARDFVRIACIPEAGMLDLEYRLLQPSIATERDGPHDRNVILERGGFHQARGLKMSCDLGGSTYIITAEQADTSNYLCGGSPEVYLTIKSGSYTILSNVVFGDSCHYYPAVTRITIGDGPKSWGGRMVQLCYSTGKDGEAVFCDWTQGNQSAFDKRFPIDQDRLKRIASHLERR